MNLDEIHVSQIEDRYMNKFPVYKEIGNLYDFRQRIITINFEDLEWLISKVKELSKPKD